MVEQELAIATFDLECAESSQVTLMRRLARAELEHDFVNSKGAELDSVRPASDS